MQKKWGQSAIRGLQENKKGALTKVVGSNRRLAVAPLNIGRALTSKLLRRRQSRTLLDFAGGTSEDKVGY